MAMMPCVNRAYVAHPQFERSIETLQGAGVRVLYGDGDFVPYEPGQGNPATYRGGPRWTPSPTYSTRPRSARLPGASHEALPHLPYLSRWSTWPTLLLRRLSSMQPACFRFWTRCPTRGTAGAACIRCPYCWRGGRGCRAGRCPIPGRDRRVDHGRTTLCGACCWLRPGSPDRAGGGPAPGDGAVCSPLSTVTRWTPRSAPFDGSEVRDGRSMGRSGRQAGRIWALQTNSPSGSRSSGYRAQSPPLSSGCMVGCSCQVWTTAPTATRRTPAT